MAVLFSCDVVADVRNRVSTRPEWTRASDRSPSEVFMANYIKASEQ